MNKHITGYLICLPFVFLAACSDSVFYANYASERGLDGLPDQLSCTLSASATDVPVNGSVLLKATFTGPVKSVSINNIKVEKQKPELFAEVKESTEFQSEVEGVSGAKATCKVVVKANKVLTPVLCQLTATPDQIKIGGSTSVHLSSLQKFETIIIDGKKVDKSIATLDIILNESRTIHAQAINENGQVAVCSVNVGVDEAPISCTLSATPSQIDFDAIATLKATVRGPVTSLKIDGERVNLGSKTLSKKFRISRHVNAEVISAKGQVASCQTLITVREEPVSCDLIASPDEIDFNAESNLMVSFRGPVQSVVIDGQAVPKTSPQILRRLTATRTISAKVVSLEGREAVCSRQVRVREEPVTCTLSASPRNIAFNGSTQLSLAFTGPVQTLTIDGQAVAKSSPMVSRTLQATKTFQASVQSQLGRVVQCSVEVGVDEEPISCSLTANANQIPYNGSVQISAELDGPVTSAVIDGQDVDILNPRVNLQLTASKRITATVRSSSNKSSTCFVDISVDEQPVSCQLVAAPSRIPYNGSTEIRLTSLGPVRTSTIDGSAVQSTSHTIRKTLASDAIIHGQVTSILGRVSICSVAVAVDEMPVSCTLSASPTQIPYGGSTNLSLQITGPAQSAVIDGQSVGLSSPNLPRTLFASRTILAEVTSVEGRKVGCSVNVGVGEQPISCTITASPSSVFINEWTQLSVQHTGPVASVRIDNESVPVSSPTLSRQVPVSKVFSAELVSVGGNTSRCEVNVTAVPNCNANPVLDANATFYTPLDVNNYRAGDMGRNNLSGNTKGYLANYVNPFCSINYDPSAPNGWNNPTLGVNQGTRDMACKLYGYQQAEEEYGYWRYASPGNNVTALWDPSTQSLRPYQASSSAVGNRVLVWTKCKGRLYDACKQSYTNEFRCRN